MARRTAVPVVTVALTGAFLACNALTGVGDLETVDDAAAPTATSTSSTSGAATSSSSGTSSSTSSASSSGEVDSGGSSSSGMPDSGGTDSSSSTSSTSSSSSSSSGDPVTVTLIADPFDADCGSWTTINATTKWVSGTGHDKAGACSFCASLDGDFFITKTVTAPRAGKVVAQMWAEHVTAAPTSANVDIGGSVSSAFSSTIGASFTLVKNGTFGGASVGSGATVTLELGKEQGLSGQCIAVDDVLVTLN